MPDGYPFFTLQPNYKYIYNATEKTADYYDDQGIKFYHRGNIKSVMDLHIDYTIHKSHQFEIHVLVDPSGKGGQVKFIWGLYDPEY